MSANSINRPLTHEEWYNKYFHRGNRFDPGGPLNAAYDVQKAQQDWKNFMASRNNVSTTSPLYDKTKSQFTSTALSGNTNTGNTTNAANATASKIGTFDKAMGGLGAAVTMFDSFKNNAEVKDLSGIEDSMMQQAYLKPEASSREALVNQWNNLTDIKDDYGISDIRQNSTWDDVSNTLNSVGAGLAAGSMIGGPVGAAIGGVAGLGASIAGIFTGRDKAQKEAERLNNMANWANTSRVSNLEAGAQSLDATDALNAMRNYSAYGGKLYGEGGDTNEKKEANTLLGLLLPDRYKAAGDLAWAGAEFIPYVGNALSAVDTGMDVARMTDKDHKNTTGDWVDLALDAAGIIPLANIFANAAKLTRGASNANKLAKTIRNIDAGIEMSSPKNMEAIRRGMEFIHNNHFFDDVAHGVGRGLTDRELNYIRSAALAASPAAERAKHIYTGIKTADAINDFTGATDSIGENINAAIGSLRLSSPRDNTVIIAPITDTIYGNGGLINMSRGYFPSFDQYAVGGELSTHGSDFTNGARYINAGGTHEENPYEGVQMGTDSEGTPNLVEEGEVVYDDYVFSDRLKPSKTALKASNLPEKYEGLTFARIAEDLLSESEERPNDPISKDGAKVMLGRLRDVQEEQRSRLEERRMKKAIDNMSPEEQQALVQGIANQMQAEQVPEDAANQPIEGDPMNMQQPAQPEPLAMAEPTMAMDPAAQGVMMGAEGGKLFPNGGTIKYDKKINGKEFEEQDFYKRFLEHLVELSELDDINKTVGKVNGKDITHSYPKKALAQEWFNHIQNAVTKSGSKYKIKDFKDLVRLASDEKVGPVHEAVRDLMKNFREGVRPGLAKDDNWFKTNGLTESMRFIRGLEPKIDDTVIRNAAIDELRKSFPIQNDKLAPARDAILRHRVAPDTPEEPVKEPKARPDYLRYAGIFGNLVGLAGNRLDYTEPEAFMEATANPRSVAFTPIGRYVNPSYVSSEEFVTPLMNQINATRDTIRSTSNGNSASANAALIAAQNAGIGQIGAARLQGKQYNDQQRNAAIQSNRAVDQYNSQGSMQAQSANMNLNNYFYQRALANAQMRTAQKNAYDTAKSANLTTLFDNLAGIGKERIAANMASDMGPYGYFIDMLTGRLGKKNTSNG